jgi:thiol:disulfide interchange protein
MKFKHLSLLIYIFLIHFSVSAQIEKHVKWSAKPSKTDLKLGEEIEITFTAEIDKDWYLYSSDFSEDLGPTVTTFEFKNDPNYIVVGKIKPIKPKKKYDETWGGEVTYFIDKGEFKQVIKIVGKEVKISASVNYQTCNDNVGKCIPGDEDFELLGFKVSGESSNTSPTKTPENTNSNTRTLSQVEAEDQENVSISNVKRSVKTNIKDTLQLERFLNNFNEGITDKVHKKADDYLDPTLIAQAKAQRETKAKEGLDADSFERYSIGAFMFFAFLAGLVALLTPCVFPMIPMTVTFFTSQSKTRGEAIRKGLLYGFSIVFIYTFVGVVISKINGPEFANWLSTHWAPNVFFFIIFLVFALSFFGLFEITLPSGLINKVDSQADKGGIIGILFMGFTLVLVSFSCTGPIVGAILVESAGGKVLKPVLGMFAFSMAFAIPFSLFAIFPHWLSSLPKSGSWLNSVKVVLGFLELALSLKFLSIADQVYHWGLLDREVYLALWVVIFTLMGFYLLGKIKLPSDSDLPSVSVSRLMLAIVTFSFVVYLIPGMWGAPLKALSGYLPPQTSLDFDIPNIIAKNASVHADNTQTTMCDVKPKFSDMLHLPHGLKGYFDFKQGMECAKAQKKPVFIDFTGHGCVNCRAMEANVWGDPEVMKRLKNDYIIIALYVDEKMELPEQEWYVSTYDNKTKNTIGKQNADLQISRFNNNAQPYYVLLDHNGKLLVSPKAYDLNVHSFVEFLDKGIAEFNSIYGEQKPVNAANKKDAKLGN